MLVPEEWHTIREKRKNGMLRHYSPRDVIEHLERICRLKIGHEWKFSEIPKKSMKLMEELELQIV